MALGDIANAISSAVAKVPVPTTSYQGYAPGQGPGSPDIVTGPKPIFTSPAQISLTSSGYVAPFAPGTPGGTSVFPTNTTNWQALSPTNVVPQSFGGSGSTGLGAGQGPGTQSTGQASDNPFNNSFFFQIPQPSGGGGASSAPATSSGGYGQYIPLIVVGVVVAGLGYYLFERKRK